LTDEPHTGVWFSDVPLDISEGADGDTILTLEVPDDVLARHEWGEDEKTYREYLCPAELVNQFGPPRIYEDHWQGQTEARLVKTIAAMEEIGAVKKAGRSAGGSRFVETMLTVIETCRQQRRNVFAFVTEAVAAHLAGQPVPSLLPGR